MAVDRVVATTPHPPPDDSIAPRLLIPVGVILGIGLVIYAARMYTRIRMYRKLNRDDYAITIAEICSIVGYTLVALSCSHGFGRHTIYVSPADRSRALFYFYLQAIVWYWGMAAMKISVAFLLLRMHEDSKAWRRILWGMIAFQFLVALFSTAWSSAFCTPTRALWESVAGARCLKNEAGQVYGYVYTVISIASDLFLSLTPLKFLRQLRRPKREKIICGMLILLGLTATTAAIKRLLDMMYQNMAGDVLHDLTIPNMWCMLEEVIGVATVSIPYLKSPMERTLRRLGFPVVVSAANGAQHPIAGMSCEPDRITTADDDDEEGLNDLESGDTDVGSSVGHSERGKVAEIELTRSPGVLPSAFP